MSIDLARELVTSYGWNATSCQILNPGIEHWFSSTAPAVVGYTQRGKTLNVAGAPVCARQDLADACADFELYASRRDKRVCYVCAEGRMHDLLVGSRNHSIIVMGAQPVWDPSSWVELVKGHASLRAQLHRSRNKGVVVQSISPKSAAEQGELRSVLQAWLESRRLPPLHFLVEPEILGSMVADRRVFVARRSANPVAFLVASPVMARNGYLVELLARSPDAPNGVSELLIDAAMRQFASDRCSYVTLGLVALASAVQPEMRSNPMWLRGMTKFARAHANRFYNFRGLEQFRVKMKPHHWEPIYAISNEKHFTLRTLYDIGGAFAGLSPWRAIGLGLAKAIREEFSAKSKRQIA
jgi:phosphatidylglycerol lysyltransferase